MRKAVIVDLDGTVALVDRRRELAMKPNGKLDWDIFLDPENISLDEPNRPIINLVHLLKNAEYKIIIVTGRYQRALGETIKWLERNSVPHDAIFTRANSDYREDSIVKKEIFEHHVQEQWEENSCGIGRADCATYWSAPVYRLSPVRSSAFQFVENTIWLLDSRKRSWLFEDNSWLLVFGKLLLVS